MMIAALLGLSWPNIRARLARKVPNKAVVAAETGGPAGRARYETRACAACGTTSGPASAT